MFRILSNKKILLIPLFQTQIIRAMHNQIEEIQIEPLPNEVPNNISDPLNSPIWKKNIKELQTYLKEQYKDRFQLGEKTTSSIQDTEGNLQDTVFSNKQMFYIPPIINKETLCADMAVKTITADLEAVDNKFNLQIKRSEELVKEWAEQIKKLEAYIEYVKGIRWKKLFTYSACVLAVLGFLWKMGMLRSIPNFTSNLVAFALDSSRKGVTHAISNSDPDTPKPSIDSMKTFLDSPITPGAFLMAVGTIAMFAGTLKLAVWILRKAPK